jgi:hypothetical protein
MLIRRTKHDLNIILIAHMDNNSQDDFLSLHHYNKFTVALHCLVVV